MIKTATDLANHYPKITAWIGSLAGWMSFDLLRASQIAAALMAFLVSLCAFVLTLPKVIEQVKKWLGK